MREPVSEESNVRCPVRVRRVISGDGSEVAHATVFCPELSRSIPLEGCASCPRCVRIDVGRFDHGSAVVCRVEASPGEGAALRGSPDSEEERARRRAAATPVARVMTGNVLCVRPDLEIEELRMLLVEQGISGVPVVDDEGRPIGIASKTDLLWDEYERLDAGEEPFGVAVRTRRGWSYGEGAVDRGSVRQRSRVGEVMTPTVLSVREQTSVLEAAAAMGREGIHRLPVVDESGGVVGILSSIDLLRWLGQPFAQR